MALLQLPGEALTTLQAGKQQSGVDKKAKEHAGRQVQHW